MNVKELTAFFIFCDYYAGGENLLDGYALDRYRVDTASANYDMKALEAVLKGDTAKQATLYMIQTYFGI